jgi:hypothetical protein
MKIVAGALIVLLVALLAGCGGGGGGDTGGTTTSGGGGKRSVLVQLQEQNFSGEAGNVTLTAQGPKTRVVIEMASYAANPQPAHIHEGTCAHLSFQPAYPLNDVKAGRSTTVVNVSLKALLNAKYAVNLHRSAKQMKTYVACGDITTHSAPAQTFTTSDDD